jgi:hypothetical protein
LSGPGRPLNLSRMVVERALRAATEAPVTRHDLLSNAVVLPNPPTPGAARMRRYRWLKQQGAVAVDFVIGADAVRSLVELGWLTPERRGDRDAVRSAIIRLAARALALRIPPGG